MIGGFFVPAACPESEGVKIGSAVNFDRKAIRP